MTGVGTHPGRFGLVLAWARYFGGRLGWAGLLGLVLAIVALAIDLFATGDIAGQNAGLQRQVERKRREAAHVATAELPASDRAALARLPGGGDLVPLVAAIHAGAQQRGITLDQGEYLWQDATAARPARYRMSFPARGSYPQLRDWAADLLARQPQLALEQFDFRRDGIGSPVVEARVRFAVRVEGIS